MKSKYFLCIFFIILPMFFCSKSDQTYTVEIKDDVKYIHNHTPIFGDTPQTSLEYVGKIGDLETEDEHYQLYQPYDLARDANGNIYVLELGDHQIQKYDANHEYAATFGRRGQGPSEFEVPTIIKLDNEGNMYVSHGSDYKIKVLSPDGKYIRQFRFSGIRIILQILAQGRYLISRNRALNIPFDEKTSLISIVDESGTELKKIGVPTIFKNQDITRSANNISTTVDSDKNIYITFHSQNRIEKYSPEGELLFVADRPLNFKLFYKTSVQQYEFQGRKTDPVTVVEMSHVSSGLGIDHKNRLWVLSYKRQKEEDDDNWSDYLEFEVFNTEGLLLFKVSFPNIYCKFIKMYHDRLYLIDTYREMCVYEYRIVEK